jgi:hypothetical protein
MVEKIGQMSLKIILVATERVIALLADDLVDIGGGAGPGRRARNLTPT